MVSQSLPPGKMKPTLAVIGSGIAGLSAAYFLRNKYDVTLFEKNDYPGGHSNTIDVEDVSFDTGFMVFNHHTYPLLTKLFSELDVATYPTFMSFSVHHMPTRMEYCGTGLNGLFGQRRNFINPSFWSLLIQINRFNTISRQFSRSTNTAVTIREYCRELNLDEQFIHKYLIPMSGAVWSTPPEKMLEFPAITLIRFFDNHGFLGMNTQHQWYTVSGGSRSYVRALLEKAKPALMLNTTVSSVHRSDEKVLVADDRGQQWKFDNCIMACHADQALKIVSDLNTDERNILSAFEYQKNLAVVHADEAVMPVRKRIWSSWNYRIQQQGDCFSNSTIYWMNNLQKLNSHRNYFVSIDDPGFIKDKHILKEIMYEHPLFSVNAVKAQNRLAELNRDNLYFCGSYHRYGFHEDALMSAAGVCESLTGNLWN